MVGVVGFVASCHRPGDPVPTLLSARPPQDPAEERAVRKLAASRHAPGDWITRARMITRSWDGARTSQIAAELHCHPQTVRERIKRFNAEGLDGLGDRPGAGRKPRLTEHQRSQLIALVKQPPPGRLRRQADGACRPISLIRRPTGPWTPSPRPPQALGIQVQRSQVRRILLAEGVRWRRSRSWAQSSDPEFAAKGPRSSRSTPTRRPARRSSAPMSSGR
jgi:transposase